MCLCRNARQCVCFRQKKRGLSIASRWLYTYINEQFLHKLAILVCLFVVPEWFLPLYLQSNCSSVMPLSLAFNFSPWICIHSSSPFYWYMSQRWTWDMDHRNNLPLLTVVMCVLCWCDYAAAAWWVLLGQKSESLLLHTAYPEGNEKLPTAKDKYQLPWYNKYM